jgi:uncharacterized membrane protein
MAAGVLLGCGALTPSEVPPEEPLDQRSTTFEAEGSWRVGGASGSSSGQWTTVGLDSEDGTPAPPTGPDLVVDQDPNTGLGAAVLAGGAFVLLVVLALVGHRRNVRAMGRRSFIPDMGEGAWLGMDVSSVALVIDRATRARLRAALDELAGSSTWTRSGMVERLKQTVGVLRAERESWRTGAVDVRPARDVDRAQERYRDALGDARARRDSLAPPKTTATGDLVVVTLVVAARTHADAATTATGEEAVHARLADLEELLPGAVAALEVVFSPSADNDGLSPNELRELHPALGRGL